MTDPRELRRSFLKAALLVVLPLLVLLAAVLLALAACSAEAGTARPLTVVVVLGGESIESDDEAIRELARSSQARGWATAIAGRWAAPRPGDLGFAAHCVFEPGAAREWGPAIRQDGQRVTLPDDVRAGTVFIEFLVAEARSADTATPALLCYRPLAAALDRGGLEPLVRQVLTAFERGRQDPGAVVILGLDRRAVAEPQGSSVPCVVGGIVDGRLALVRRELAASGEVVGLVNAAVRLNRLRLGDALIEDLGGVVLRAGDRARR